MLSIPTTLRIRTRSGNVLSGDMVEDQSGVPGVEAPVTFYYRGVAFRDLLAFVTYKVDGPGQWPLLYELQLGRAGRLSGEWWEPDFDARGEIRLRRRPGGAQR